MKFLDYLLVALLILGTILFLTDSSNLKADTATGCAWYTPSILCPNGPSPRGCNSTEPCGNAVGKIGGTFCACGPGQYDAHTEGQDPGCYRDCTCIFVAGLCTYDPVFNCTYHPADLWVQDPCGG